MRTQEQLVGLIARVAAMLGIVVVLALLYFGRDILVPITLAIILSLLITPSIRLLRRVGFGHASSVAVAVILTAAVLLAIGAAIGVQVLRIGESLSLYTDTFREKLDFLNHLTFGRIGVLTDQAYRLFEGLGLGTAGDLTNGGLAVTGDAASKGMTIELRAPLVKPMELIIQVLSFMWKPLESAGIVLVVLVFVLFEHEALRDRFIRLAGRDDLRGTTIAVNDAGERLSRFFISQLLVNVSVGCTIGTVLFAMGVSQAFLWGAIAAILRFIPYVGVWIAAACAAVMAAAISPGFTLALMTIAVFFFIEILFAQVVEPKLYGHTTGLSPLSIVVAAIFWSWLWGPVGLILSTPLTLCLVVSGRYFRAFNVFEILLGEIPALTMPQNFYQRALSGDVQEILISARSWMRLKSFAAYCDSVLIPALHLARHDMDAKTITNAEPPPSGSMVLCMGAGGMGDELAAEILLRILKRQGVEGRHILPDTLDDFVSGLASSNDVPVCCVVSIAPVLEHDAVLTILQGLGAAIPAAHRMALLIASPFEELIPREYALGAPVEIANSLEGAVQSCLQHLHAFDA